MFLSPEACVLYVVVNILGCTLSKWSSASHEWRVKVKTSLVRHLNPQIDNAVKDVKDFSMKVEKSMGNALPAFTIVPFGGCVMLCMAMRRILKSCRTPVFPLLPDVR